MANKRVVYPSLMDAVKALGEAHNAIHAAVKQHAAAHQEKIVNQRRILQAQHAARKLTGG
jgi:hypothetical protein